MMQPRTKRVWGAVLLGPLTLLATAIVALVTSPLLFVAALGSAWDGGGSRWFVNYLFALVAIAGSAIVTLISYRIYRSRRLAVLTLGIAIATQAVAVTAVNERDKRAERRRASITSDFDTALVPTPSDSIHRSSDPTAHLGLADERSRLTDKQEDAMRSLWPEWRFPDVSTEVREWATRRKEDPTVAHGDFDDDGTEDVALLIQPAANSASRKIVACLSSMGATNPIVIEKPYCSDGIASVPKGDRYYDFGTDLEGTYPKDGIHAYCFQKAGATYIFEGGAFRRIVDSD